MQDLTPVFKARDILNQHNPVLVKAGLDKNIADAADTYGINPKAILATIAQEQNWGRNGKLDKIAGIDGGGGGNPVSLSLEKSIDKAAYTYAKFFYGVDDNNIPQVKINYDPKDREQKAVLGNGLGNWQKTHQDDVSALHQGFLYQPRTASEYAKLRYTPFTYFAPQHQSRPYDMWVNLYKGFK